MRREGMSWWASRLQRCRAVPREMPWSLAVVAYYCIHFLLRGVILLYAVGHLQHAIVGGGWARARHIEVLM